MKIPTPSVTTGQAGKRAYLLVKRFDRTEVSGRWRRLHQEDFCQALGKTPSAKYEANQTGIRGPALKDMFELTRRTSAASAARARRSISLKYSTKKFIRRSYPTQTSRWWPPSCRHSRPSVPAMRTGSRTRWPGGCLGERAARELSRRANRKVAGAFFRSSDSGEVG